MPPHPRMNHNLITDHIPASLGGDPVEMQRRYLLKAALGTAALTLGGPALAAADTMPSVLEAEGSARNAIDVAERGVLALAAGHMRPDTEPADVQAGAVGLWRDMASLARKGNLGSHLHGRALYVQSLAASVVASIHGQSRDWDHAAPWYKNAVAAGRAASDKGHVGGDGAAVLADCLKAKTIIYVYPDKADVALALAIAATDEADHPHYGFTTPGGALAPSLMARARALAGDRKGALTALDHAASWFDRHGYYVRPWHGDEDVPLLDGPLSLFGYGERAHHYSAAEVHAATGDVTAARAATLAYLEGEPASTTSATLLALAEARCLGVAGKVAEGAEHAHAVLAALPEGKRNATITTRGVEVAEFLKSKAGSGSAPGPVDAYASFARLLDAPMAAAV